MRRIALGFIGAAAVACTAKGILEGLDSFPCAADGTCPAGFACQADAGCRSTGSSSVTKNTDGLCVRGDRCGATECNYGVCPAPRGDEGDCPADHPIATQGGCLASCESGHSCPSALSCMPVVALNARRNQYMARGCVAPWQAAALDDRCGSDEACNQSGKNGETGYSFLQNIQCVDSTCVSPCLSPDGGLGCPAGHVCLDRGMEEGCFLP